MKKIKLMIGIIIVVIICLITVLYYLSKKNDDNTIANESNSTVVNNAVIEDSVQNEIKNELHYVEDENEFFSVVSYMNQYFNAFDITSLQSNDEEDITDDDIKEYATSNLYNLLDKSYVEKNNVTADILTEDIKKYNDLQTLFNIPLKMKKITTDDNSVNRYVVYGISENIDYKYLNNFYLIINVKQNEDKYIFSVEPLDASNYKDIDDVELNSNNIKLDANDVNLTEKANITDRDIAVNLVDYYKKLSLGKSDIAYNLIDKQYREKKYGSLEDYEKYISDNIDTQQKIYLKEYAVNDVDGKKEYVGKDQYGKYYIFDMNKSGTYNIILDTYTVNLPQFTEKYEKADSRKKVGMNINKILEAINDKDYNYVYGKLNADYRNNNFSDISKLEEYINEKFITTDVEYNEFNDLGGTYTYQVTFKDTNDSVIFIMKLLDNEDFEIAFEL